jgi:hypothetical protein
MPAPIDYGVEVADPTKAFLGAFQAGASIQEARFKQQKQEKEQANQLLIQEGFKKLSGPNATAADYANLSMMLPETQAKAVRESFNMLSGERQQTALQQAGQVFSAFKAGKPDIAISLLEQQIAAKRNSKDEEGAKFLETWRDVAKMNPSATETYFGYNISQMPGGEKVIESAIKLGDEARAAALQPSVLSKAESEAKTSKSTADIKAIEAQFAERLQQAGLTEKNWNVKNLQSQISDRAAKLNLDKQTTQATVAEKLSAIQQRLTDIPESARKLINESATQSATSAQAATQYNDLARRIESAEGGLGKLTSVSQWLRTNTGQQDAWTQIRNEYTRVRNSVAIKSLPPGVATDKDIELALKGIPPENANAAVLASFLRGTAKLQDIDSSINNAKTDWLSQNNGLLTRAKTTFIAGDYAAKSGETFNDFAQRIVGNVASKYRSPEQTAEEVRQATFAKIPTNQTPVAAPTQTSIEMQADAILRGGR